MYREALQARKRERFVRKKKIIKKEEIFPHREFAQQYCMCRSARIE
jgi:hypothetical protein